MQYYYYINILYSVLGVAQDEGTHKEFARDKTT
jgi:hypothetical protein